jgi:hypothetical protein
VPALPAALEHGTTGQYRGTIAFFPDNRYSQSRKKALEGLKKEAQQKELDILNGSIKMVTP